MQYGGRLAARKHPKCSFSAPAVISMGFGAAGLREWLRGERGKFGTSIVLKAGEGAFVLLTPKVAMSARSSAVEPEYAPVFAWDASLCVWDGLLSPKRSAFQGCLDEGVPQRDRRPLKPATLFPHPDTTKKICAACFAVRRLRAIPWRSAIFGSKREAFGGVFAVELLSHEVF